MTTATVEPEVSDREAQRAAQFPLLAEIDQDHAARREQHDQKKELTQRNIERLKQQLAALNTELATATSELQRLSWVQPVPTASIDSRRAIVATIAQLAHPGIASLRNNLQRELEVVNAARIHREERRTGVRFPDGTYEIETLSSEPVITKQRGLLLAGLKELQSFPTSPIDGEALEEKLRQIRASVPAFANTMKRIG